MKYDSYKSRVYNGYTRRIIARYEVIYYWVLELRTSIEIKSFFRYDLIKDRLFVNDFEEKSLQNIQMMVRKVNYELELTYKIIIGSKEITSYSYDWQTITQILMVWSGVYYKLRKSLWFEVKAITS